MLVTVAAEEDDGLGELGSCLRLEVEKKRKSDEILFFFSFEKMEERRKKEATSSLASLARSKENKEAAS